MLKLYQGDTSVCAQKVRLNLFEKGLEFDGPILDLGAGEQRQPDYLKLNPNGVVPTLVDDGKVIIESTVINEYLDDNYPEIPMKPADAYARAGMRLWTKLPDDGIHYAVNTLSFVVYNRFASMASKSAGETDAQHARRIDPDKGAKARELSEAGLDSPLVASAVRLFEKMFTRMEDALAETTWLAGDDFTLADIALIPYVNRMDMMRFSSMWEDTRPHIADWLARARERPSYAQAILDFDPPERIALMQTQGALAWPKIKELI